MTKEALKLALRALEKLACLGNGIMRGNSIGNQIAIDALTAIKEALAQPKQHQDWCASLTQMLMSMPPKPAPCNCKPKPEQEPCCYAGIAHDCHAGKGCRIAERMKAAQTEQEPVAWEQFYPDMGKPQLTPPQGIYYTPPQRTWVNATTWRGLTDEDLEAEFGFIDELLRDTCYRTETKLKAKNSL